MLKQEERLKSKDFGKLKKGVYKNTPLFNTKIYNANLLDNTDRLAIIIPKKNIKKANKRNALKRKVCYAYRKLKKENTAAEQNSAEKKVILLHYVKRDILNSKTLPTYKDIEENIKTILYN